MRDLADLTRSVASTPEALRRGAVKGVGAAALHVTGEIRQEIRGATGGDMRLSGVGRRGARVGARYEMRGSAMDASATVRATGPLQFVEHDTAPHEIAPRRRRKTVALKLPDGYVRRVRHPGTRGKRPFARGAERGALRSTEKFNTAVERELVRTWT